MNRWTLGKILREFPWLQGLQICEENGCPTLMELLDSGNVDDLDVNVVPLTTSAFDGCREIRYDTRSRLWSRTEYLLFQSEAPMEIRMRTIPKIVRGDWVSREKVKQLGDCILEAIDLRLKQTRGLVRIVMYRDRDRSYVAITVNVVR